MYKKSSRHRMAARTKTERTLLAVSIVLSSAAHGQTAASAGEQAGNASETAGLNEIVVTAQRREERLQDVPISVSAFSGEAIEAAGFRDTRDILVSTPNVDFTTNGRGFASSADISIRGVGTIVRDVDQPVAVYLDEVFLGTSAGVNLSAVDLERVEVLRGPQGTLYGRNALAGAVNYVSREPVNRPEGSAEISYGNYEYMQMKATGNLPLAGEKLMARANVSYTQRDGTVENLATGTDINDLDNVSARLQLKSNISDALTLKLAGEYSRDKIVASSVAPRSIAREHQNNMFAPFEEQRDIIGASARLTYDAERFQLISISGYRAVEDSYLGSYQAPTDLAVLGGEPASDQRQFSQELRLVSTSEGPLKWVVGAYYFDETNDLTSYFEFHGLAPIMSFLFGDPTGSMIPVGYNERSDARLNNEALAGFGELSYALTDRMEATIGARYGEETREMAYSHVAAPFLGFGIFAPPQSFEVDDTLSSFLPKLTLSYRVSDDAMVYGTVSKGYKSGGFSNSYLPSAVDANGAPIVGTPTNEQLRANYQFDPETLWNYELGFKTAWMGNRLVLNGAAFFMDWRDQQLSTYVENVFRISNADKTRSYGAELELAARPTDALAFNLGVGYNDSSFRGDTIVRHPLTSAPTLAAGNRQPNSSRITANLGAQYTANVGPDLRMPFRLDVVHRSSQFFDPLNLPELHQPAYQVVNLRAGLETDRWAITLFANNLTDEDYITSGYADSLQFLIPAPSDPFQVAVGDPRTYGIVARVKF
jgi:iron complex outermembrane receptor protein